MADAIRELFQSHGLLAEWTARPLRARYQQSILGWLWAVLQPAAQAAILAVVFTYFVPVDTGATPYFVFVFAGTAAWTFLSASITEMTNAIVDNMTLVNKVRFSRAALPMAAMLARLVDYGITMGLVVAVAIGAGLAAVSPALAALPLILTIHILLILGIGLTTAAANVFVRDVRSVVQLGLQIWFYASPVLYPVERVPASIRPYYDLNPMAGVLEAYRAVLFRGAWPDVSFAGAALVSIVLAIAGLSIFTRLERRFADVV
jgi:ABC-type polysaccharide/polyol phosphate export permease